MSRFCFCNCPAGFSAEPERHAPDCPGRSGAGKARTPVPATNPVLKVTAAEDLDAVLHWRNKHAVAIKARDGLQLLLNAVDQRKDELESLLEQVLTNANRGLPAELQRSLRELLPAQEAPTPANEEEREPFEAWHRSRFSTRHSSGQPTRDMHGGIRDPNYGPPDQQQMWEAWQARAALAAPTA